MVIALEGSIVLAKGVAQILFTASAGELPGLFSGKIDLNALSNAADEIKITLQVKYTSGGGFVQAEEPADSLQADKILRLTPVEETYGYQITLELLAASPSANATLPFIVLRTDAPT